LHPSQSIKPGKNRSETMPATKHDREETQTAAKEAAEQPAKSAKVSEEDTAAKKAEVETAGKGKKTTGAVPAEEPAEKTGSKTASKAETDGLPDVPEAVILAADPDNDATPNEIKEQVEHATKQPVSVDEPAVEAAADAANETAAAKAEEAKAAEPAEPTAA